MPEPTVFLGVDAGATRSRARAVDAAGRALAEADAGPANLHLDRDGAFANLRGLVDATLERAGIGAAARGGVALGLGVAGLVGRGDAGAVARAFLGFGRVEVAGDGVAALLGAHGGGDGGILIFGTGAVALGRVGGATFEIGGRGLDLGDDASGAWIGREILRAALRARDGLGPASALTRDALAPFLGEPARAVAFARDASPGDFGRFAPKAFAAADAGDEVALDILGRAAREVAVYVAALEARGVARIAFAGGVAEPLRRRLAADLALRLVAPAHDAVVGAILLAGGPAP
ncbi:MAG: N-acetylglucosamine kinase [Hyphomicrobiales bacterium]|nr:N-acetylglucosamine kinase [Hyphomicrobiales bacterium]MDE2016698.1 N-acetylglucosamine kinase [Hyphomicrobiales bacterium]